MAKALVEAGHEVLIVTPAVGVSGAGASVGAGEPGESIPVDLVTLPGLENVPVYIHHRPPALGVCAAMLGVFGEAPDAVVSGINLGWNPSWQHMHSGTVGAALTAANFGGLGIAVSIDYGDDLQWRTAADVAVVTLASMPASKAPLTMSINVPNVQATALRGVRVARLAPHATLEAFTVSGPGSAFRFERNYSDEILPQDSDVALLKQGYATITPLRIPHEDDRENAAAVVQRVINSF